MERFKELDALAYEISFRNRDDLIRKLKDMELKSPDERPASFDVKILFSSIPLKQEWLPRKNLTYLTWKRETGTILKLATGIYMK